MKEVTLTTIDNPYNPFTEFDKWRAYDESMGYYTIQFLGRLARTSHELSPSEQLAENERVVDEIVKLNILGIYKKVSREIKEEDLYLK